MTERRCVQKERKVLKQLIMKNEKAMLLQTLSTPFSHIKSNKKAARIFFVGDNAFVCDYLLASFAQSHAPGDRGRRPVGHLVACG